MSRNKKSIMLLVFIVVVNVLLALLYSVLVYAEEVIPVTQEETVSGETNEEAFVMPGVPVAVNADESSGVYDAGVISEEPAAETPTEVKKLESEITVGSRVSAHTADERYYVNEPVSIKIKSGENQELIDKNINELKELFPDETIEYYADIIDGMSVYDGEKFTDYTDISDGTVTLSPMDNDTYRRHVVRLKRIISYKFTRTGKTSEAGCETDSVTAGKPDGVTDGESAGEKIVERMLEEIYISPVYQIVFDKTAPVITGSSNGDSLKNINPNTSVSFNIKDETGIASVVITKNGNATDNINLTGDERITEYNYELILSAENASGDEICVSAADLAGNISQYKISYSIDTVAPVIAMSGADDGKVYGSADITVNTSDNSGHVNLFYKCVYTNGFGESSVPESMTYCNYGEPGTGAGFSGSLKRHYADEGIYDITAFAYDENGNYSDTVRVSFGIDANAPKLSLDNVTDGGIYGSDVSMHAVLTELFYDNVSVKSACTITDGDDVKTVALSPFEVGAKVNKNIYTFNEEGVYDISLNASDASGHDSSAVKHFTIDKSKPVLDLTVDDEAVYSEKPEIRVKAADKYTEYEAMTCLIRKNGSNGYTLEDSERVVSVGRGTDFSVPVTREGEYVLKVTAKDAAGNTAEKNIEFTVDEAAPVINYLSDFNEKYLKAFSMPEGLDAFIEDMTDVKYKAYVNSEQVSSCDITKDGKYIVQIVAEDEAGNVSEESAAFIVDATAPKVIVSGINTEGNVSINDTVSLTLFDGDDYFEKVSVNGVPVVVAGDMRHVSIPVNDYGDMVIDVKAMDYAGNETVQTIKTNCVFKSNPFDVKLDKSDIKTLIKEESVDADTIASPGKENTLIIWILCALAAAACAVFAFVDIKKLKCDTK